MKIKLEYPWPCLTDKDPDCFGDITMFDLSFNTIIHYFKNHSTGYSEFQFKILGFGVRVSSER